MSVFATKSKKKNLMHKFENDRPRWSLFLKMPSDI